MTGERAARLRPERRLSKADQVYAEIKESIMSGVLEPGQAIDKLTLCAKLGVSRFPVTTAINRLAFERLVSIEPQHGSFVAKIAKRDVAEWLMIRRALEAEIANNAANTLPDAARRDLERNLRYQQPAAEAHDVAGFYALDLEFHRILARGLDLAQATEILDMLHSHLERSRRILLVPRSNLTKAYEGHQRVYDAIVERDGAKAEQAMRGHLDATRAHFETLVNEHPELFMA
ncbi:MAG: GntR family transcriptional regulator [Hyphomicrobiales bacterium]|nr:GntR family transcriptional regulator [Hyphomicrobiales bacterium]